MGLRILILAVLFTFAWFDDASAQNGSISGRVEISKITSSAPAGRGIYRGPTARTAGSTASETPTAVVWLEAESAVDGRSAGAAPVLNQKDKQFNPGLIVIRQGESVNVVNSDPLYHNVFSLSSAKKFDIGRRRTGESVEVKFDKPGVIEVFCDIHSHMNATILVMSNRAVDWAEKQSGEVFRFDGLNGGSYQLHVLVPGSEVVSRKIDVGSGQAVDAGTISLEVR